MKMNCYGLGLYLEFLSRIRGRIITQIRVVDFIIFETEDVDRPLGLLSISGYKAGKIAFIFPKEAF